MIVDYKGLEQVELSKEIKMQKKIAGTDEKGIYRVDTAEKVNEMVSSFLEK